MTPQLLDPQARVRVACALCGQEESQLICTLEEIGLRQRRYLPWPVVRCTSCTLVYVKLRLPDPRLREPYEREDYGFRREEISRGDDPVFYARRVLGEIEALSPPGELLDVGCATGEFLAQARSRGWRVQGLELSPYAARSAQERYGLSVRCASLREAAFPAASFDLVTLWDVMEHLPDLGADLQELRRILKPGGLLAFETPNWNSIYRRLLGKRWNAYQPRVHLYYFTATTAQRLLERYGFHVLKLTTEVVDLFSREGRARGFTPLQVKSLMRELVVKHLYFHPNTPWARAVRRYLAAQPRPAAALGSYSAGLQQGQPAHGVGLVSPGSSPAWWGRVVSLLNWPTNALFLRLGMGEQLRGFAQKRGETP